jgi:hypothetical protein
MIAYRVNLAFLEALRIAQMARCTRFLLSYASQPCRDSMFDFSLNSTRSRFRAAILVAVVADAVQIVAFSLFAEGAISPLDDGLDVVVAVLLTALVGWHWEFAPSFIAELVPGLDLVPFWTLAVANVYRKWKRFDRFATQVDVAPLT